MAEPTPTKMRVGVLFGGRSSEHAISLRSAASVVRAMDPDRYDVELLAIDEEGRWWHAGDGARIRGGEDLEATGTPIAFLCDPSRAGWVRLDGAPLENVVGVDVVFPVLHGPYGEDGTVQGLLELAGVPYVGSGVVASAVGMDKALARAVFRDAGLPLTRDAVVPRATWEEDRDGVCAVVVESLTFPLFVKPANLGSSVGISRIASPEELGRAMDLAATFDRKIVVEEAVRNPREFEVAVLGNNEPEPSVVGEIRPSGEFYDYESKYHDDTSELLIPAPIPEKAADHMRRMAVEAFRRVDCAGLARVDFLASDEEIYINEINTMPGFTSISMYPQLWEASGLGYGVLVDALIAFGLERHEDRKRNAIRP